MQDYIVTFVSLFIALDTLGNIPFVISLTEGMNQGERYRVIHIAVITATIVGMVFLFFGQFILKVLNISVGSFAIAGGIVLLILSVRHMITGHMTRIIKEEMVAVVPIGTPLVAGPATITTLLLLSEEYRIYIVLLVFLVNMVICWLLFMLSNQIIRIFGLGGLRAVSRVFSLLLAAIGISMMIHGLDLMNIINVTK